MAGIDDRPEPAHRASVEEITEDIERTRQEVGETVSALTDKLDVKGRAQAKVAIKPGLPAAASVVATAAVLLGLIVWRRRRQGGKR